jgi:hypothetical protein
MLDLQFPTQSSLEKRNQNPVQDPQNAKMLMTLPCHVTLNALLPL